MKTKLLFAVVCLASLTAQALPPTNFAGAWQFKPEQSKNVGMMGQMKIALTVEQSDAALDISARSTYEGKEHESKTHLDLTGGPATNESPMGGANETVSKWDGAKLVTVWTGPSAVAGATITRTETRSLSGDGKVMTVESVRGSNPPIVMVFTRK